MALDNIKAQIIKHCADGFISAKVSAIILLPKDAGHCGCPIIISTFSMYKVYFEIETR